MTARRTLTALLITAALSGCANMPSPGALIGGLFASGAPRTQALAAAPAPIARPLLRRLRSMEVVSLIDGKRQTLSVRRSGSGVRVRESGGCVWTKTGSWFAPSDSFANCSASRHWRQATARVRMRDNIFPLRLGAKGAYTRRAVSSTGKTSNRETRCEVVDAVAVERPDGALTPSFVVSCDDGRITRTTWYAPKEGPVAYREVHRKSGLREAWVRAR